MDKSFIHNIAEIMIEGGIERPLDYFIPKMLEGKVQVGSYVQVPVRTTNRHGLVLKLKTESAFTNLASIQKLHTAHPFLSGALIRLANWISYYYVAPLSKTLRLFLPSSLRKETSEKIQYQIKAAISNKKLIALAQQLRKKAPAQALVIDLLLQKRQVPMSAIAQSASALNSLVKKNVIIKEAIVTQEALLKEEEFIKDRPKKLKQEQQKALNAIQAALEKKVFAPFLLHGITGSGKTEVYLQAIQAALVLGKGIIMLVPEIALTAQTLERFFRRFNEKIGVIHSRLNDREKQDIYHAILKKEVRIVVGARSALFCPMQNLGLIILDEEHDSSYKQSQSAPCYHARDVAIMRGCIEKCAVVLGSATPSLESYFNAKQGKYTLLSLTKRAENTALPCFEVVDMKQEFAKKGGFTLFSDALLQGVKERALIGEQSLLFLNRRGYHTYQICLECGKSQHCPSCDLNLTFHRLENKLACHLCGYTLSPPPKHCSQCKKQASMKFKGAGTEQVQRALHAVLPDIRTLRMDMDTTRNKGALEHLFRSFRSGKADVLIGTQMIAKGLHFPSVTLVGIINVDGSLNIPDFRAGEHTFQLITQVAGRSGRSQLAGKVVLQTLLPNHPTIQLAVRHEIAPFCEQECSIRQMLDYPPFTRLVKITCSGEEKPHVEVHAKTIHTFLVENLSSAYKIYPPIPSGYAKIQDQFRYKIIVKGKESHALKSTLLRLPSNKSIQHLIDVDPSSLFF